MKKQRFAAAVVTLAAAALALSACGSGDGQGVPGVPGNQQTAASAPATPTGAAPAPPTAPATDQPSVPTASVPAPGPSTEAPAPPAGGTMTGAQLEGVIKQLMSTYQGSKLLPASQATSSLQASLGAVAGLDPAAVQPAACGDAMVNTGMRLTGNPQAAGMIVAGAQGSGSIMLISTDDAEMFSLMKAMYDRQHQACATYTMEQQGETIEGAVAPWTPAGISGDVVIGTSMSMKMPAGNGTMVQTAVIVQRGGKGVLATVIGTEASQTAKDQATKMASDALAAFGA